MVKGKVLGDENVEGEDYDTKSTQLKEIMERMKKLENKEVVEEPVEEVIEESTDEKSMVVEDIKTGELVNYTEKIDFGVIDEEGNRIPCKTIAEAKILSLLLKLVGGK